MIKAWKETEMLPAFIVVSLFMIFAVVIGMLLVRPMPLTEAAGTLLTALVGMLSTKISTIVDFYFGSNKASKDKDAANADQAKTIAQLATAPAVAVPAVAANTAATVANTEAVKADTQANIPKEP